VPLDWVFPKAYASFITNLFDESFEDPYIDRINKWTLWRQRTCLETLLQLAINHTILRFGLGITKLVNEERYERIDSAIANLGSHVKPRSCGEEADFLCFYVNKLKRYKANDKKCFNRKECQMQKDCYFAFFKSRIVVWYLSESLNRSDQQYSTSKIHYQHYNIG
jgi:hypothetical protein